MNISKDGDNKECAILIAWDVFLSARIQILKKGHSPGSLWHVKAYTIAKNSFLATAGDDLPLEMKQVNVLAGELDKRHKIPIRNEAKTNTFCCLPRVVLRSALQFLTNKEVARCRNLSTKMNIFVRENGFLYDDLFAGWDWLCEAACRVGKLDMVRNILKEHPGFYASALAGVAEFSSTEVTRDFLATPGIHWDIWSIHFAYEYIKSAETLRLFKSWIPRCQGVCRFKTAIGKHVGETTDEDVQQALAIESQCQDGKLQKLRQWAEQLVFTLTKEEDEFRCLNGEVRILYERL